MLSLDRKRFWLCFVEVQLVLGQEKGRCWAWCSWLLSTLWTENPSAHIQVPGAFAFFTVRSLNAWRFPQCICVGAGSWDGAHIPSAGVTGGQGHEGMCSEVGAVAELRSVPLRWRERLLKPPPQQPDAGVRAACSAGSWVKKPKGVYVPPDQWHCTCPVPVSHPFLVKTPEVVSIPSTGSGLVGLLLK